MNRCLTDGARRKQGCPAWQGMAWAVKAEAAAEPANHVPDIGEGLQRCPAHAGHAGREAMPHAPEEDRRARNDSPTVRRSGPEGALRWSRRPSSASDARGVGTVRQAARCSCCRSAAAPTHPWCGGRPAFTVSRTAPRYAAARSRRQGPAAFCRYQRIRALRRSCFQGQVSIPGVGDTCP